MSKISDFSIETHGRTTVIQIIDKSYEFEEKDFLIFKEFLSDFFIKATEKHKKQGYLHSNNIDEILNKYENI